MKLLHASNALANYFTVLAFLLPSASEAQIQGKVYRDFNANGVFDSTSTFKEIGLSGITVTAYNAAGVSVGTTITNSTGNYTIASISGAMRVEFTGLTRGDFAGPRGANSGTSIQFVTAPATNIHFGLNYPQEYCGSTNPTLATPCYINGDPLNGGTAAVGDVFVGFPFNATQYDVPTNHYATGSQIGSTWGVAYQRQTKTLFTAAFLKRHVGLGPLGIGGIYKVDGTSLIPASNNFVDVKTIGIDVGTVVSNAVRGLLNDETQPNNDAPAVFDQIGKVGMGDMDITDDDKKLFLTNLNDRKLYSIIIDSDNNTATAPTAADVQSYTIPNPNCTNGVARPFGLKIYKGNVYVGVVCTAENVGGTVNNMYAYIYALDLTTGLFNATPVFSFPLNYPKLSVEALDGAGWQPWTANHTDFAFTDEGSNYRVIRPQPMLVDMAFDVDGSMILIFIDRTGHQYGFRNYSPDVADSRLFNAEVGGDILRVANVNGIFQLEHNGTAGALTGANVGNNGGPGTLSGSSYTAPYGEFYDDETIATVHNDCIQGGAVVLAGSEQVAVCTMDPMNWTTGGIVTWSNTTGQQVNQYELYSSNVQNFGKANGLGDLEMLCAPAPIEIGNRVWADTDKDGIQDAGEAGINGLTVQLYAANGTTLLASTTTSGNGNYYFSSLTTSSLTYNTNYILKFPTTSGALGITTTNSGTNDNIDSDVAANGQLSFTTGNAGQNDHSFDIGYASCTTPTTPTLSSPQNNPCPTTTVNLNALSASLTPSVTGGVFEWHVSNSAGAAFVSNPTTVTNGIYYLFEKAPVANCYSTAQAVTVTIQTCCPVSICLPASVLRNN
ncbi:MAG: hypothetical protein RIS64_2687 [Bacteroidota bacterium]|jgi:SdrD B-like domain